MGFDTSEVNLFFVKLVKFGVFILDSHFVTIYSNRSRPRVQLLSILSSIHLEVVERKEGLRLSSLLLDVLDAISASLLRVNNDGVHVLAQHFGHSNLILLLSGLAQVD